MQNILKPFKDLGTSLRLGAETLFDVAPPIKLPERRRRHVAVSTEDEIIRAAWRDVGDAMRQAMGQINERS